jgi:hypothetical protein
VEVQQLRSYTVSWRFISLKMINEHRDDEGYTPAYRGVHLAGLQGLRVADAVRMDVGDDAVGGWYTALGQFIHRDKRRPELIDDAVAGFSAVLAAAGLPVDLAAAALDESRDVHIRAESELALGRTGRDVGTPILTFHPGAANEGSFFGPVIASIPRGDDAVRLWDAVEVIATTSGMAELKRSNRGEINFD